MGFLGPNVLSFLAEDLVVLIQSLTILLKIVFDGMEIVSKLLTSLFDQAIIKGDGSSGV